jgi:hypothetical protein
MDGNKVLEAINAKGINPNCTFCGKNDWAITTQISAAVPMGETGDFVIGNGQIVPMIHMACLHCGHIEQFNPIILGLMKSN